MTFGIQFKGDVPSLTWTNFYLKNAKEMQQMQTQNAVSGLVYFWSGYPVVFLNISQDNTYCL